MNRRVGVTVLAGALVAMLLVAAASTGSVQYVERAPSLRGGREATTTATTTTLPAEPLPRGEGRQSEIPDFFGTIVEITLVAGAVALAALAIRYLWRARADLEWRGRRRTRSVDAPDDIAAAITRDAAAQYAALRTGAPRNAIVACWLRLESAVIDAGYQRDPADTSDEFTQRVLADFVVDPQAIADLAALYREARFSQHHMDESSRQRAISSLERVHSDLRVRTTRSSTETHEAGNAAR